MARNAATAGMIIFVCCILGLFIDFIEQIAYANGWMINQYITDPSMLPGLQIMTLVVWALAGAILAALIS
jgi:hypothetical protein